MITGTASVLRALSMCRAKGFACLAPPVHTVMLRGGLFTEMSHFAKVTGLAAGDGGMWTQGHRIPGSPCYDDTLRWLQDTSVQTPALSLDSLCPSFSLFFSMETCVFISPPSHRLSPPSRKCSEVCLPRQEKLTPAPSPGVANRCHLGDLWRPL